MDEMGPTTGPIASIPDGPLPEEAPPPRPIGFDHSRIEPFFREVPRLWWQAQAPVHEAYQELLYTTEHAFGADDLRHIGRLFGLPSPQWGRESQEEAIALFDGMRFPDTLGLARLRAVPGLTLSAVSHYLHFFHHTYPIYHPDAVRALNGLGATVPWTKVRDPAAYGLYIAAIEELRDRIPFWDVPETNVHTNRIIEAALEAWGGRDGTPSRPSVPS